MSSFSSDGSTGAAEAASKAPNAAAPAVKQSASAQHEQAFLKTLSPEELKEYLEECRKAREDHANTHLRELRRQAAKRLGLVKGGPKPQFYQDPAISKEKRAEK